MTTNILIGFGGTGAKVVESTLHAAAAGLGPDTLHVGFVDQDQANGNVSRAKSLLQNLAATRRLWRSSGSPHRIGPSSPLLKTDIRPLTGDSKDELWIPHRSQKISLSRIFGEMPDDQRLFDLLYEKGPAEQGMELDEGYRGRPHIGAAAITSQVQDDVEFWKILLKHIKDSQGGVSVRLLLAGSVFGGTGAAGFPTIARLIRRRLREERIEKNVFVGGVLMLPYFSFDSPEDENGKAANVARSEELLLNSKEALNFYHNIFQHEHIFDELYLVGWDKPFRLGYHKAGAGDQKNPALAPELFAGLGACRFFNPAHRIEESQHNRVFVSARESATRIAWSDLPSPDPATRDAPYQRLGQVLRFAVAWKRWGPIITKEKGMIAKRLTGHSWFRAQGIDRVDFKGADPTDEVKALDAYVNELLAWAAAIQAYATEEGYSFDLWSIDDLLEGRPDLTTPQSPVKIRQTLAEAAYGDAFGKIVVEREASGGLPDANALLTRFNQVRIEGDHEGLGRAVAALHQFSAVVA